MRIHSAMLHRRCRVIPLLAHQLSPISRLASLAPFCEAAPLSTFVVSAPETAWVSIASKLDRGRWEAPRICFTRGFV